MKDTMGHKGTFKKVGQSKKRMHGPRGLLICGYPIGEHDPFVHMIEKIGLAGVPVIFATSQDLESTVGDLLVREDKVGLKRDSAMQRAVIMSGLTQKELHTLMDVYRKAGLPSQLWASLTPVSQDWPLRKLLEELERESKSVRRQGK